MNAIYLRGGQGAPFCSTLQLSRYFKMLSWSYNGGFFGNSNWCRKNGCLNRTGDKPLRSIGKAATSVLPPLTTLSLFSTQELVLQVSLWSRIRALPSLSGPRLFQLQKQTCQKLWPLRALVFEARLLLPSFSSKGNIPRTVRLRRPSRFLPLIHSPRNSVQTASKSCGCFATAWI